MIPTQSELNAAEARAMDDLRQAERADADRIVQPMVDVLYGFLAKISGKPAGARRDHAAYATYLDAANGLAWSMEAGEIQPHQRPSIDKRGPLWWVTHNA